MLPAIAALARVALPKVATNIDRAEAILTARHRKDQMEGDGAVGCFDAAAAAEELHAAGLLAPEPAPDCTLTPGSTWSEGHHLNNALDQSPYTSAVIIDRDDDLAMWNNGYWEGPAFLPVNNPGEGPWRIIWVGPEPEEA